MQDPEILRQRAKVGVIPDNELEKNGTAREAIVEVALIDCQHFSEHVTAVRGTVENPMTSDEVMAKAKTLIAPVIGEERGKALVQKIFALENVKDVRELHALLSI
jgi:2-methylcitrate dehydratase PrpD